MTQSLHSSTRDVTALQRQAQPTPPTAHYLMFLCHHKGARAGAWMRGTVPYRCAACVKGAA